MGSGRAMTTAVAFDFETYPFGPSNLAPKPVCFSIANNEGLRTLVASCEEEFVGLLKYVFTCDLIININVAFDACVALGHVPEIAPLVWKAYKEERVTCLIVREKLLNNATTGDLKFATMPDGSKFPIGYSLVDLEKKYLKIDRSEEKDDPEAWRSNYNALEGRPAKDYPPEARDYAIADSVNALDIYFAQERRSEKLGLNPLAAQFLNTKAALFLYLSSCWGFPVDAEEVERVYADLSEKYKETAVVNGKPAYANLLATGILRPSVPAVPYVKQEARAIEALGGLKPVSWEPHIEALTARGIKFKKPEPSSYDLAALRTEIERVCNERGIVPKMTDGGESGENKKVSYGEEALMDLKGHSDTIDEYIARSELQKLVTTELPRMRAGRVHPKYDILKVTGRTSSYGNSKKDKDPAYPAVNIQNIDPRVRHAYIASPGNVLCSVDYSFIELVSVAQKCIDLFGESVLAQVINKGWDPHAYLASDIICMVQPTFAEKDPETTYYKFLDLKKSKVEEYDHWRGLAKPTGLGLPGGLGAARFIGYAKAQYGIDLIKIAGSLDAALSMAKQLKQRWLNTYPEMRKYFNWITTDCVDPEFSDPEETRYCYVSPFGMIRRNCVYTEVANGAALQTATAEGAKCALFELAVACYDESAKNILLGTHPLAFIHDEVICEMPDDEFLHERATEQARIMVQGMKRVMRDVRVSAEPAVMRRWNKKAKKVLDASGRILVWEEKEKKN